MVSGKENSMESPPDRSMEVQPERLKNLLRDLVNIYSPTGKEGEILEYAEEYLKNQNLPVTKQEVDETRCNLIVLPEKKDEIVLCLVGHLDTVTAYDLDDYGFHEEEDTIFGLGTADMKAGCAAMIEALTVMARRGETVPPVGLALVVDEEEDNKGIKALVSEYSFPWAVVGEPTGLMPCLGHYGYLEVMLRTQGKRAHPAMPELGQNAIENMLKLLLQVTESISSRVDGLVYNIREMSGFPGGFVVPDSCEAWLDLHLPPSSRIDVLKTEFERLLEEARENIPNLDVQLNFEDTYSGYQISQERPLVKKLKEVYGKMSLAWETQEFRSHSDGNVLWSAGVNPIILGPGHLETAHTAKESVSFCQVIGAAKLYLNLALSL
jgi:acetylornithine deacetylase